MIRNQEIRIVTGRLSKLLLVFSLMVFLTSCGGNSDGDNTPQASNYTIGGTVSGLEGSGLVLQNNGGDDLEISDDGVFTFDTAVPNLEDYDVAVKHQPANPSQTCTVSSGSGTMESSDVTSVIIECTTNSYAVGGTVSGLEGSGLVLQNNGGDDLEILADGDFAFDAPVTSGVDYDVTVKTQPIGPNQTCEVVDPVGTVTNADVSVAVECAEAYILPTNATEIGLGASSVLVDGNFVYLTEVATRTFKVLDVSDPLNPLLLGSVVHGYTDLRVEAHAIYDHIVWCVRSSSGGYGIATYLFGVDVSDPENPVLRGSLTLQSGTSLISSASLIYEGYLFVHDYSDNLVYVIDISDPDNPTKYSQWAVPNMVNGGPGIMMIDGSLLYLPCGENGTLRIYDLSDLTSVTEVGYVSAGGQCYGTAVKLGSYVYMTTNVPNMKVIDVSDPTTPTVAGTAAFTGYLKGRNSKLFSFSSPGSTISAYSLVDPIAPEVEDSVTVPIPAPSTTLDLAHLAYPDATWVGDYLIGMTYGSASQYSGARAIDFIVK